MDYRISRQASAVIDEIIRYTIANFGDEQASDYVAGLYHSFELLTDNPKLGRVWSGGDKRLYIYRSHYVLYRIMPVHLFITDIRNTRQEIPPEWER